MEKSKYPIAIFELIPQGVGSGFIREDTLKSNKPDEIIHPRVRAINKCSVIKKYSEEFKAEVNVRTRFVYGEAEIIEQKLKERNVTFSTEKPTFVNGLLTVAKDGATVGLYNFLTTHAQNITNPDRLDYLKPLFREVKPAENAQQINVSEFAVSDAVAYIKNLLTEKSGGYQFSEERIDALCTQFNVAAESYEAKISGLIYFAKTNPIYFLNEAKKTEQIVIIQINHALKLKVIAFEGNTAMYVNKNVKIKSFAGNLGSDEKKISTLANYFQTLDGKEQYELFVAELNAAKEAKLTEQ